MAAPLPKTRGIEGQVMPLPSDDPRYPPYELIGDDAVISLADLFEMYSGCVVRVSIELVEARP